ncbi:cache domain-containing protein [Microbacterium sp.]|uniref:cache domain-containing protein n=1 Tax=Microbacterium sp. TaxID=51671 RepID=UPI003A86D056
MTRTSATRAAEIAARIATTIDDIFATVDRWRVTLERALDDGMPLAAASVDPLVESFAVPAVAGGTLVTGAGFVATPGVLSDAHWHLAWWLGGSPGLRRLATIDDPHHDQFRDYTTLEWWRVPTSTGNLHVTGPYVDYLCTDDYAVTITVPVRHASSQVGLVGADALVDRLEREILPVLRTAEGPASVVNASARVVTSTDARREPGSLMREPGILDAVREAVAVAAKPGTRPPVQTGAVRVLACGDTSLALVLGA